MPGEAQALDVGQALAPRFEGPADAPVTMIEYFSLTCPHCATFHEKAYPGVKEKYIDSGRIRFEYRDFPLDQWALRAAAMARAADPAKYPALVGILFKQQSQWTRAGDILSALKLIGQLAGLSAAQVEEAMTDEALIDGILRGRIEANETYGVDSTPSFIIGDERARPRHLTFEVFDELLSNAGA